MNSSFGRFVFQKLNAAAEFGLCYHHHRVDSVVIIIIIISAICLPLRVSNLFPIICVCAAQTDDHLFLFETKQNASRENHPAHSFWWWDDGGGGPAEKTSQLRALRNFNVHPMFSCGETLIDRRLGNNSGH